MNTDYLQAEIDRITTERDGYIQQANIQVAAFNGALQWIEQHIEKAANAVKETEEHGTKPDQLQ